MKNAFKTSLLFAGIMSLLFTQHACMKEYSDFDKISKTVDYSPSIAAAIAHTKLTARDIIRDYDEDELFEEGADGFLYLMYDKRVYTEMADELIFLSDQTFPTMNQYTKAVYDGLPVVNGYRHFPSLSIPNLFYVNNQEQLDSIRFDAMDINIVVNSSFNLHGSLNITFPTLKKNGNPLTVTVYPDNSGNFHYDYDTYIEDYTLVFDNNNNILAEFDLSLIDGSANSGALVDVTISMKNLDFDAIYGYVGRISTPIPQDTVNISIFDNAFDGDVWFKDPSITLNISNSFGLPIRNYFGDLQTFSVKNGGIWENHDFPIDELSINYPTSIGSTAYQSELLNIDNFSSIRDLVSSQPKYLFFEVDSVIINPDNYNQSSINFVLDTSRVSVDMEVKLPLEGNAWYSLVDTLELDIEDNFEDISKHFIEANLRIIFDNFLPTDAYVQVIFTDSLYQPIDTLFKNNEQISSQYDGERLLKSAILDNNGRALQPVKQITDILFGNGSEYNHDINDLERVKNAIIIATLRTNEDGLVGGAPAPIVKFYADNYLEVKFGVKGQGKYEEPLN